MNISKKLFQTFKKKAKKILPNEVKAFLKDQLKGFKSQELNISDSGKRSDNFIAIDGIVFKRLSSVEADKKKSNQHEFNGSNYLKELLGKAEPKEFRVNFAWIESSDICLLEEGFVTWYDARRSHPSRSEYRLYFKDNVISKRFSVNDPLFIIKRDDRNLLLISTKAYSTVESQLLYLFALDNNNFENKRNSRDVFQKGEILDFEFKSRALDDYVLEFFRESSRDEKKNQSFLEPKEDESVALAEEIEPKEDESVALAEEIEPIEEEPVALAEEIEPIEEEPVALAEEKEEEIKEEPVALAEKKQEAQKVLSVKVKEEKKSLNVVKKGSNILSWKEQLQIIKEEIENKPDSLKEEIDLDPKVTFSLESKVSKVDKNNKNSSKDENLDFSTEVAQKDEEEFIEEISIDRSQQEFLKMMEDNNVICIAPPGHGKTATAIESISYYLKFSNYTKPKNIFFLSFTNAAVNEALFRLKSIQDGPLVQCYTVDSFAGKLNQLVRENTGLKFPTSTYDENMIAATKFVQGVADKDSKDCVQGFIDQTIDLLIIDETQDINNLRFDFIKSLLRRINKECRVLVFGDHLQEIYSFQENNNKGTLLNYLKENKTHLNFKIHSLKTNHRIKNKNLLSTYEFARKNYEDEISIKEKNNNLKKHLKDLYSGSIVDTKNKKQKTTVYLFRRNIDVISHVLSRYKNFKKTSFRIRSLHEIINPFFAFIFRNFLQKEKLKLDDLWQEIFDFDIERFEALYKINPGEFVDSIDYFFGDENNCLDLKKIEEDIRFRQMPECFKTRKWGLGKNIFSSIHSYKGRESENVVLNMQSNALQGRSEKLNEDEYRIYYVGLTRAKKNLQYTEFVSEKVDYKKFLNKREFIPSYNGIFIGRKGDVIWSNFPEAYLNDMSQEWFSKHPNKIIELEIIYNDKSLKEPSFDILTKKKGIYIGCLSEPLAKNIRFEFSDYMPPRFGNIFMVGTTTALIEDFLPREEDNKKIVEINKNIQNKPKIIFYPNVVGILSPKV